MCDVFVQRDAAIAYAGFVFSAYSTVLRLSSVCRLSVTLCIVAKRCVLEQKLLSTAYRKSYMRNQLVPK